MDLETKRLIVKEALPSIHKHVHRRTVAVIPHDGQRPVNPGSGTLFEIEGKKLVVTAAHVVKNHKIENIQIIGSRSPCNFKNAPRLKEAMGGGRRDNRDVAYLVLDPETVARFEDKEFATLDCLDVFPSGLCDDLMLFFGMLETPDSRPEHSLYSYQSDGYFDNVAADFDWRGNKNHPFAIEMPYPERVIDARSGEWVELPDPHGKSGGGLWRVSFKDKLVWTPDSVRFLGINISWHPAAGEGIVRCNRPHVLLRLLGRHFPTAREFLKQQIDKINAESTPP